MILFTNYYKWGSAVAESTNIEHKKAWKNKKAKYFVTAFQLKDDLDLDH